MIMENFMDLMWWALTFGVPFLIGNMGGGGGQQASPPKLDVAGSLKLSQGQINQLIQNAPEVARVLGDVGRSQSAQNTLFGLNMLTNPGATLRGASRDQGIQAAQKTRDDKLKRLRKQFKDRKITQDEFDKRQADIRTAYQKQAQKVRQDAKGMRPLQDLQKTFSKEFGDRNKLLKSLNQAQKSSPEYRRAQEAMRKGVTAQQLERGELGESLYATALERAQSQGQLTPEAERDAVQAARSGMAARGMATGNAALGAELLNRDRYSRQRMEQDLAFARGVQTEDLTRREFNALQRDNTNRFNIGLLGTASSMADAERGRQLGLQQDAYNFRLGTNPRMMLAGLGSPYANMQTPGLSQLGGITASVAPQYSGGQLSKPGWFETLMGTVGQVAQAGGQAYAASASDKRLKKDIKQIGKDGVLGLKTYEYRFKGEGKDTPKHVGFMAQEVQKVIPEAVEEFDYKGKKRLAIKPAVIGQTLAAALEAQQAAMFNEGYTVGSGL